MNVRRIDQEPEHPNGPPPLPPPSVDRFQGALLGCALGDVVGSWVERRSVEQAKEFAKRLRDFNFSEVGKHHHGMAFGQYTDDTQLSRELMLSIVESQGFDPEDYAQRIARIFSQDAIVGCGRATKQAASRLIDGVSWEEAGEPAPSAGNGAAMRAGPIGLLYYYDTLECIRSSRDQARITHQAETSVAASVAISLATAMGVNASKATSGPHEMGWWEWLHYYLKNKTSSEFATTLQKLIELVMVGRRRRKRSAGDQEEQDMVQKLILKDDDPSWRGISPWAQSSTLWSLYCVMTHPYDLWKALELAISVGGDSDTIAAMAGTVVGACTGATSFPEKALQEIAPLVHDVKAPEYDWEGLKNLGSQFHAVVERAYQGRLESWQKSGAQKPPEN